MTASSQKPPRDGCKFRVHLQPHGAAGKEEVVEAGLGSGAMAPLTSSVSLTRTPCAPPTIESQGAVGSQRTSGASMVAFRVLAAATVTSLSRLMPQSAKLASSKLSSLRTVTRAFWICRSPAELRSSGVSRKLVAVRLLTVRAAVGATPPLFSRAVTHVLTRPSMEVTVLPRELKFATKG